MRPGVIDKLPWEKPARFSADHLRAPRVPSPAELNKAETTKAVLKPDEPLVVAVQRAAEQLNARAAALTVVAGLVLTAGMALLATAEDGKQIDSRPRC
jgi:hypothetical protein